MTAPSPLRAAVACDAHCIHPDAVQQARAALSEEATALGLMAELFDALSDPTRLRLLVALLGGRLCTCDLAVVLGVTDSAVSHHLRLLKGLGLVATDREGRVAYHRLADDHVRALVEVARAHVEEELREVKPPSDTPVEA